MSNIRLLICTTVVFLSLAGVARSDSITDLRFRIDRQLPYLSIDESTLREAATLLDLNPRFKPSWVRMYLAVDVAVLHQGKTIRATGDGFLLNSMQKELLRKADAGTPITAHIRYIPDNTLPFFEIKELDFTLTVDPVHAAGFAGGQIKLEQYMREKAIQPIPYGSFAASRLAAITFVVDTNGEIIDPRIVETTENDAVDRILLTAVNNMPCWEPARYADGTTVQQTFVLSVGNLENCMINTLGVRRFY